MKSAPKRLKIKNLASSKLFPKLFLIGRISLRNRKRTLLKLFENIYKNPDGHNNIPLTIQKKEKKMNSSKRNLTMKPSLYLIVTIWKRLPLLIRHLSHNSNHWYGTKKDFDTSVFVGTITPFYFPDYPLTTPFSTWRSYIRNIPLIIFLTLDSTRLSAFLFFAKIFAFI